VIKIEETGCKKPSKTSKPDDSGRWKTGAWHVGPPCILSGERSDFVKEETAVLVLLFLLWVLLSGKITLNVCLTGAAAAALLDVFCRRTLGYGGWGFLPPRKFWKLLCYLGYLIVEMLKAGFVVMNLIYTRGRKMEPVLVRFDTDVKSDDARSMLANSITLTAGTITVTSEEGHCCVHALDRSLAVGIEHSKFERRLKELEE